MPVNHSAEKLETGGSLGLAGSQPTQIGKPQVSVENKNGGE